jgi:uncharacterized protein (DUF3084 family)
LYEKIKIQQSTLAKGEVQYNERLEDIRLLKVKGQRHSFEPRTDPFFSFFSFLCKIKIADLKRELTLLRNSVGKVDTLKNEIYHLERQLLQERTKVKALSEELENPLNIHRWRKLEGSDPTAYEMIQKIQTLQKRLISKTEEVVEKDLQIQEHQKNIEALESQLKRQLAPEVAQKLSVYKANLKEKTKQLKVRLSSKKHFFDAPKKPLISFFFFLLSRR